MSAWTLGRGEGGEAGGGRSVHSAGEGQGFKVRSGLGVAEADHICLCRRNCNSPPGGTVSPWSRYLRSPGLRGPVTRVRQVSLGIRQPGLWQVWTENLEQTLRFSELPIAWRRTGNSQRDFLRGPLRGWKETTYAKARHRPDIRNTK